MLKQKQLNRWFWKWHVIAGLISLPVMLLLSITGVIYLFKEHYNNAIYSEARFVEPARSASGTPHLDQPHLDQQLSFDTQLASVKAVTDLHVSQLILPTAENQANAFRLHAKKGDHTRNLVYVNPYTAEVSGQLNQRETLMYKVRKLHGELLLSKVGTLTVELIASWFIVLIITGLYVWWPTKRFKDAGLAGFFTLRTKKGKRVFFRDLHAVGGFWLSLLMLIILSGGMPWTDTFGGGLKWVQKQTNTGYPTHWNNARGLESSGGEQALSLDRMVEIAKNQQLPGQLTIKLPMDETQVFSVTNRSLWLRDQQSLHFDQYTGNLVKSYHWGDVGILMEMRQIAMRLHQGEYGFANWIIVLVIVLLFTVSTSAGLVSYILRKPKGRWGIPTVPEGFQVGLGIISIIAVLGVVFPIFGASLLVIILFDGLAKLRLRSAALTR